MRRAPRPCLTCHTLGTWPKGGRCPTCTRTRDRARGTRQQRGLNAEHDRNRRTLLATNPPCHWCGAPATQADHLTPRAHAGGNDIANLVPACAACNAKRGGRTRRQ